MSAIRLLALRIAAAFTLFAAIAIVPIDTHAGDGEKPAVSAPELVDVFVSGREGYHTYRIPALAVTNQGTLLAFCEGRKTSRSDHGDLDLVLRRSADGGHTWSAMQIVHEEGGTAKITIGNPCPVIDRRTGTIWLSFCRDNDRVFMTRSDDDGATWAEPTEITDRAKQNGWDWYATGPGHGIQLDHGRHKGRLLMPCDHRVRGAESWKTNGRSHIIYSDDHGKSWNLGGITAAGMNECQAVELADGSILLSMRNYHDTGRRAFAKSSDGGRSWSTPEFHEQVSCPVCQSSIARFSLGSKPSRNRILYSGPGRSDARMDMTVRLSYDEGRTWPVAKVAYAGPSAYSDLAVLSDRTILCLFERGEDHAYERITLARLSLQWLTDGRDADPNTD